jgi:hypothetical protein
MRATTGCACFTILLSFALTIVGFPENSLTHDGENLPGHPLTALNLYPAAIGERNYIPIYNPAMAFERDENHRAKRHLFKKKKGKKGYQQVQQSPPIIIVNQYPGNKGGHGGGGGWAQPSYVQPTYVQPTYVQPKPTYVQPTYVQPIHVTPVHVHNHESYDGGYHIQPRQPTQNNGWGR